LRVNIRPYSEEWPLAFARIRESLRGALSARAQRIEHIGSTAVPGLDAKPVIDILLEIHDVTDFDVREILKHAGYHLVVDEPGHRMFRSSSHDVHLHVWQSSDAEIERHLLFRDRLRENNADRLFYAREKRRLATTEWPTQNDYAQAKSPVIAQILARARESRKP